MKRFLIILCVWAVVLFFSMDNRAQSVDIVGNWLVTYSFRDGGGGSMEMRITRNGNSLKVLNRQRYSSNNYGDWKRDTGTVNGKKVTIVLVGMHQGIQRSRYIGTLSRNQIKGIISGSGGPGTFVATKEE